MSKTELFNDFYKKCTSIDENVLGYYLTKDNTYIDLHKKDEDIIDAIITYCVWNRSTTKIKEYEYQNAKDVLLKNSIIKG